MFKNYESHGWIERNIAEEPRLTELVEFYEELGYKVMLKDISQEFLNSEQCNTCLLQNPEKYKIIFTLKQI